MSRFQLRAEGVGDGERTALSGASTCDLEGRAFLCEIPAGVLDLRIEAAGFAPVYCWGLEVEPGSALDLGRLELARGASVTGTVVDGRSLVPIEDAVVELRPTGLTSDQDPVNRKRSEVRRQEAVTDERGFFQVAGLLHGMYQVSAAREGFAEGPRANVEVADEREYRLEDPLFLAPPTALEVLLTPPLDPYGRPWRVRLVRHVRGNEYEPVRDVPATAAPSGAWKAEALEPGSYMVRIGNELDPSWHLERIEVGTEDRVVDVVLDFVAVEGALSLAGEPLAGTLWFGGRHGEESVRFDADLEGEFRGYLPREGEWPVELSRIGWQGVQGLEPVTVERSSGQSVARVLVELPDTTLRGRVIDEAGRPQPKARLLAVNFEEGSRELTEIADEEGRFEFRGLTPSTLRIQAESRAGVSDWIAVQLEEGRDGSEVVLRIAERHQFRGRVVSPAGPVADATVKLIPAFTGSAPAAVVEINTAVDGTFEAEVPDHVRTLNVLVLPPGFAARILTHSIRHGSEAKARLDPLEIRVGAAGGTLALISEAGAEARRPSGLLLSSGAMVGIEYFTSWARLHGEPLGADGRFRVPSIESGWYRLCPRSLLAPDGRQGTATCDQGHLSAGGELELSLRPNQESTR